MFLAILVNLIQLFFGAMRWKEISALCNAPLGLTQALRYNMIGTFFNRTRRLVATPVRLWLVKHTGAGWRAATYSVLVDRAIGPIALALLVVASLPWLYDPIEHEGPARAGRCRCRGDLRWPWLSAARRLAVGLVKDLEADTPFSRPRCHRQPPFVRPRDLRASRSWPG
jgi:hypothetical protein